MRVKLAFALFLCSLSAYAGSVHFTGFELSGKGLSSQGWGASGSAVTGMTPDRACITAFFPDYTAGAIRSGQGSFFAQAGGVNNISTIHDICIPAHTAPLYTTVWVNFATAGSWPRTDFFFGWYNSGGDKIDVGMNTSGQATLRINAGSSVSTSTVYKNFGWLEVQVYTNEVDTAIAIFNRTDTLRQVGAIAGGTMLTLQLGWADRFGTAISCSMDDIQINDASGTYENWWPDDTAHIVNLMPIADEGTYGNWKPGDNSAQSNMWDIVNGYSGSAGREGPTGVTSASESATTNIQDRTSSTTSNYIAYCESFEEVTVNRSGPIVGIPAGSAIRVMQTLVRHGEHSDAANGTGAVQLVANPAEASEKTFNFGFNLNAHLTEADGSFSPSVSSTYKWRTSAGDPIYFPTVVRATRPQLSVGRRTADAFQYDIDQMSISVVYGSPLPGGATARSHH